MLNSIMEWLTQDVFVLIWVGLALTAFIGSLMTTAPYGRHVRAGWGMTIPNRSAWIIMELPALLIVPTLFIISGTTSLVHILLALLWSGHYVHRTFIFPFKIRTTNKVMPVSVVMMAIFFNLINGCVVSTVFWLPPNTSSMIVVLGIILFLIGMYINMRSDYYLIGLRTKSQDYVIPRGFLFNRISCPNHFGEILEWTGFALIACSIGPWLFVLWTASNLIPRALSHHKWYKNEFNNYPPHRKAIIPFVL